MICQKNVAARVRGLIFLCIYIKNFKIKIFVRNHWTHFIITWQKCFLVDPLPRLFKLSWFIKKPGRQGAGLIFIVYLYRKVFKIFLSETNGPISVSLGRNVSLVTLYQDCSSRYDLSKNMTARGRGIFSLYIYIENFKNLLKETVGSSSMYLGRNVALVTFYQDCSRPHDTSKNMATRGRGLFFLYICIENFKILHIRNHLSDFIITWQECCFDDLLPRLFKQSWFIKKHSCKGWGLFSLYI